MRSVVEWKWKLTPAVTLLAVTAGLLAGQTPDRPAGPEAPPASGGAPAPAPLPAPRPRAGEILVWTAGRAVLLRPDGTVVREWKGEQVPEAFAARLSPDGRTVAVLRAADTRQSQEKVFVGGRQFRGDFRWSLYKLTLYPVAETLQGTDREVPGDSAAFLAWSPDGTRLYVGTHEDDGTYQTHLRRKNLAYYAVDAKSGKQVPLKLPDGHRLHDVSADGRHFLTSGPDPKQPGRGVFRVPAGGGEAERLTDEDAYEAVFSPDGKRVLMCGYTSPALAAADGPIFLPPAKIDRWFDAVTLADRKRATAIPLEAGEGALNCRYSPDGGRVVSLRTAAPRMNQPSPGREVVVSDGDGKSRKVVFAVDDGELALRVLIDWR